MSFVATNLAHQQLWTKVDTFERGGFTFCTGIPPQRLHPDDDDPPKRETVLVSHTRDNWSVAQWAAVFRAVDCDRVVMAMVTSDSTVVYYMVYRGLQVPRKN